MITTRRSIFLEIRTNLYSLSHFTSFSLELWRVGRIACDSSKISSLLHSCSVLFSAWETGLILSSQIWNSLKWQCQNIIYDFRAQQYIDYITLYLFEILIKAAHFTPAHHGELWSWFSCYVLLTDNLRKWIVVWSWCVVRFPAFSPSTKCVWWGGLTDHLTRRSKIVGSWAWYI